MKVRAALAKLGKIPEDGRDHSKAPLGGDGVGLDDHRRPRRGGR